MLDIVDLVDFDDVGVLEVLKLVIYICREVPQENQRIRVVYINIKKCAQDGVVGADHL